MKIAYSLLSVLLCLTVTIDPSLAQRGFSGRGFGDRGGDRSSRFGGDRGDRSRSWGGDRGSMGGDRGRSWGGDRGGFSGRSGGPGGRSFDPAQAGTRIAGFFDRNRDGRIDPDELQRMPSSFRDRFQRAGIDMRNGISVEDFGRRAGEAIRARMGEGGRSEERSRRDDGRNNDPNSTRTSSGRTVFKQSERQKLTQELPEEYQDGDADEDGQIALFEWAAWKRSDMFAFFELDENQDGFLTPRELNQAESEQDRGISMKRDRLAISSGSGGRRGGSSRVRSAGSGRTESSRSPEQTSRDSARANYYFGALDRDRDGMISDQEWSRSRIVRGTLEKAGIKVGPMSKETFVSNYVKAAAANGNDDRGSDPRRSWGDRGDSGGDSRRSWGDRSRGGFDRGSMGRGGFDRGSRGGSDRGR